MQAGCDANLFSHFYSRRVSESLEEGREKVRDADHRLSICLDGLKVNGKLSLSADRMGGGGGLRGPLDPIENVCLVSSLYLP